MILGSGWWFLSNLGRVLTHESVEAVVIDLIPSTDSDGDPVYGPVYGFEVDGVSYRYESPVDLGGFLVPDIGDEKTLLYNPDNPSDARVRNWFLLLILPAIVLAIPFLILGALGWSFVRRRNRTADWPAPEATTVPPWPPIDVPDSSRQSIEAIFMGTEPSQMDAKGDVRYRVKAKAEIDGTVRRFVGDWIDEDPTLLFMEQGNTVEVRIDPANPASYELVMPEAE
jgi:hypothetical protein